MNTNMNLVELATNITALAVDKYANNSYMLNRIQHHISNLSNLFETDLRIYEQRIERNDELTNELELFSKAFLTHNKYYYLSTNNTFYTYDGKTYSIIKEDDILHNLLSTISNEGKLVQWKYKTKSTLLRQIKERNLFSCIPETYTIEKVTNFLQERLFETKQEAKYFLTIIGDGLLRKQTNNMYFVSSNVKEFINYVDELIFAITRSYSYQSNFVSRYHSVHDITNYRLIPEKENTNDSTTTTSDLNKALDNIFIDLLCVATYYSKCYESAENFIQVEAKDSLRDYTLFFVNKSVNNIIDDFVKNCFTKVEPTESISSSSNNNSITINWRSMLKIWDKYLTELNIPNFIRHDSLKDILKTLTLTNTSETEDTIFVGITSKYLSTKQSSKK